MATISRDEIYEALFDDEAFARFPDLVARVANARSSMIYWRHSANKHETLVASYFTADVIARLPGLLPYDPWTNAGLRRPNELIRFDEWMSPQSYERTVLYNELVRPFGDDTARCMGIAWSAPTGVGQIGVHRGRSQPGFSEEEQARLQSRLPDFERVVKIRGELAGARAALAHAKAGADSVGVAIITLNGAGRVLFANELAEVVLRRADGIVQRDGRVVASSHADAVRLADAVTRATAPSDCAATAITVGRDSGAAPYRVTVVPAPSGGAAARAVLMFRDPDLIQPTLNDRLRSFFNLTTAESAVAIALSQGKTPAEIAEVRGVSLNTLKVQMRAVAGKMECVRQSQISSIVAALPPVLPPRFEN